MRSSWHRWRRTLPSARISSSFRLRRACPCQQRTLWLTAQRLLRRASPLRGPFRTSHSWCACAWTLQRARALTRSFWRGAVEGEGALAPQHQEGVQRRAAQVPAQRARRRARQPRHAPKAALSPYDSPDARTVGGQRRLVERPRSPRARRLAPPRQRPWSRRRPLSASGGAFSSLAILGIVLMERCAVQGLVRVVGRPWPGAVRGSPQHCGRDGACW